MLDRRRTHLRVAHAADSVEQHPAKVHIRIELLKARHQCSGTSCHAPCIDHQHHGSIKQPGYVRRAPRILEGAVAVKQSHDAFDHRYIRISACTRKERPHLLRSA